MLSFLTRFFIKTTLVAAIVETVLYIYVARYGVSVPVFFLAVEG
jgi:hypothetical protein